MHLIVRPLVSQDVPQAAAILYKSWTEVFSAWIPPQQLARMSLEAAAKSWQSIVSGNNTFHGLGAFEDETLLGTVIWGAPREDKSFEAELGSMLVLPQSFRRGIGRALLRATLVDMREKGVRNFYLNCIDENTRAVQFYEKEGGRRLAGVVARDGYRELRYYWKL